MSVLARLRERAKDVHLNPHEGQVLWVLASYVNHKTGRAHPSVAELREITGFADSTVRRSLVRLAAMDLIADTGDRVGKTGRIIVWLLAPEPNPPSRGGGLEGAQSCANPPRIRRELSAAEVGSTSLPSVERSASKPGEQSAGPEREEIDVESSGSCARPPRARGAPNTPVDAKAMRLVEAATQALSSRRFQRPTFGEQRKGIDRLAATEAFQRGWIEEADLVAAVLANCETARNWRAFFGSERAVRNTVERTLVIWRQRQQPSTEVVAAPASAERASPVWLREAVDHMAEGQR